MLSFRDMTFCTYGDCSKAETCFRLLSDERKEEARKWGGADAPIAIFVGKPECYVEADQSELFIE